MTAPLSVTVELPGSELEEIIAKMVRQELGPEVSRFDRGGLALRAVVVEAVKRAVDPLARGPLVAEIVQAAVETKLRRAIEEAVGEELVRLAKRAAKEAVKARAADAAEMVQAQLPIPKGGSK